MNEALCVHSVGAHCEFMMIKIKTGCSLSATSRRREDVHLRRLLLRVVGLCEELVKMALKAR